MMIKDYVCIGLCVTRHSLSSRTSWETNICTMLARHLRVSAFKSIQRGGIADLHLIKGAFCLNLDETHPVFFLVIIKNIPNNNITLYFKRFMSKIFKIK
jgi:hypothetical protein